jgi:hypothetical protein
MAMIECVIEISHINEMYDILKIIDEWKLVRNADYTFAYEQPTYDDQYNLLTAKQVRLNFVDEKYAIWLKLKWE